MALYPGKQQGVQPGTKHHQWHALLGDEPSNHDLQVAVFNTIMHTVQNTITGSYLKSKKFEYRHKHSNEPPLASLKFNFFLHDYIDHIFWGLFNACIVPIVLADPELASCGSLRAILVQPPHQASFCLETMLC